ncbi:MAG: sugar kinase, partial [Saccharofermentans sp.]|nr:sugar kinase [Saccharofermentans sp.]
MSKFLTFGELMLRLKSPGRERLMQSPSLEATFGGGEANVAVSLANYGLDAEFLSVIPSNSIGDAAIGELRRFNVGTDKIIRTDGRMGIYYLETGANQRASKVIYDRAYSAISMFDPEKYDWDSIYN